MAVGLPRLEWLVFGTRWLVAWRAGCVCGDLVLAEGPAPGVGAWAVTMMSLMAWQRPMSGGEGGNCQK